MNTPESTDRSRRAALAILALGIAVRIAVFWVLAPQNNDNHFEVIRYIGRFWRLPPTGAFVQSYHPPLYHALGALMMTLGGLKTIQFLSLLFSVATLVVIHRLLGRLGWVSGRLRPWCLALPALHPQFILYTLFVSNDPLAILLGALIFDQGARVLERPSLGRQALLAVWLGLGLLTKFSFLAFAPPVALLLGLANARQGLAGRALARRLAALALLATLLGGYKFVENAVNYRDPFVNSLDFDFAWIEDQRPTWVGPRSLFDVNVLKLVRQPVVSASTIRSWSLIMYGSFWYSYVPECGFLGNVGGYGWIGSVLYVFALAPTLLLLGGLGRALGGLLGRGRPRPPEERIFLGFALLILALNLLLVEHAGWKYDVWSVFQGRLLFPAYFAFLLLLHEGLAWAERRRGPGLAARGALGGLFAVFLLYLAVESTLAARHPVNPNRHYFVPFKIDMKQAAGAGIPLRPETGARNVASGGSDPLEAAQEKAWILSASRTVASSSAFSAGTAA